MRRKDQGTRHKAQSHESRVARENAARSWALALPPDPGQQVTQHSEIVVREPFQYVTIHRFRRRDQPGRHPATLRLELAENLPPVRAVPDPPHQPIPLQTVD